ncbi:MAG: ribonuclease P protein component [Planctomycetes bacterium]|nr:ribonuclease P protein component [Planctomycetota bacterium]
MSTRRCASPDAAFGLPRTARLRSQREFRRVYGRGVRAHGKLLIAVGLRTLAGFRLGLAVSREHGTAVRRNKLKRILREAFRLERPTLPGAFDLVLIPRKREGKLLLADARRELVTLVTRLCAEPQKGNGRRRGARPPKDTP